jgi:hypothetical protein
MIATAGLDLLEAAFAAGLSPDAGSTARTFLQNAAANGDVPTVALCIKYGADLEKRNSRGETALGYACSWGHLPVVRLLVHAGANVNALEHDPEDDFRNTALDCCARHPDIGAFLHSVGAKRAAELADGAAWVTRVAPHDVQLPVIVLEGGDVSLHPSLADATGSLEGVDVAERVYRVFDSAGRRIVLRAEGVHRGRFTVEVGTVHVERIESSPAGIAELRGALIEYLTANGRTGLGAADLATLVDAVRQAGA